ncbi:neuronal acetylcholine receptor subunit alpha-10-like [Lingula anatina]|uniref:Neuronal acetylcholine receptor subunit alpha-10-like n=1 Tax=Lingula anatina TaxID=7574 RepID=A0A1S3K4B1_LINAN|nr:neuronal acetylcholine receptor subunit alpha-10-like [Lingula anatina]|eukprot:XP_013417362.1 neuronal acetylcholine receptor subunit alpha-10-like [Lingula anatina]
MRTHAHGADSYSSLTNLKADLLKNYKPGSRPIWNQSLPTTVLIDIAVNQLIELSAVDQTLFVSIWVRQEWQDHLLKWNASDHDNISSFHIPITSIWRPDTTLYNDVREEERDVTSYPAVVRSDGTVKWNTPIIYRASCRMNVRYFPYDQHDCPLKFGSWNYNGNQLDLFNKSSTGDMRSFVLNGAWELLDVPVRRTVTVYGCCPEPYPDVTFYLVLCRKPLFYVYNLVLPCILILVMTAVSFKLPVESGEKVSFGITVVLALMVFLQIVASETPTQSEVLPLLGVYFGVVLVLLCLSTASCVLVSNYHFSGERGHQVPGWMQTLFFGYLATITCKRKTVREALGGIYRKKRSKQLLTFKKHKSEKEQKVGKFKFTGELHNGVHNNSEGSVLACIDESRESPDIADPSDVQMQLLQDDPDPRLETNRILQKILHKFEAEETHKKEVRKDDSLQTEWQLIAVIIDTLAMYIYFIVTVIATVMFFASAPNCPQGSH